MLQVPVTILFTANLYKFVNVNTVVQDGRREHGDVGRRI